MRIDLTDRYLDFGRDTRRDHPVFVRHIDFRQKGARVARGRGADKTDRAGTLFSCNEQHSRRLAVLKLPQRLLRHLNGHGERRVIDNAPHIASGLNILSTVKAKRFHPPGERRHDHRVVQRLFSRCHLRARRGERGFGLCNTVGRRHPAFPKRAGIVEIPLSAFQLGARAGQFGLTLFRLEPRNGRRCLDILTLLHKNLGNLARGFRTNGRVPVRHRLSFRLEELRHRLCRGRRDRNGHRQYLGLLGNRFVFLGR